MSRVISKNGVLNLNGVPLDGYTATNTSFNSDPFWMAYTTHLGLDVSWPATGTPVGEFKLQCCNNKERGPEGTLVSADNYGASWDWVDIINSNVDTTASTTDGSPVFYNLADCGFRWVRLVYTRTSGSITITTRLQIKE